jgi:hypothetical protein
VECFRRQQALDLAQTGPLIAAFKACAHFENKLELHFLLAPWRERGERQAFVLFGVDDMAGAWSCESSRRYSAERGQGSKVNSINKIWYLPLLYLKSRYENFLTLIHSKVRPSLTLLRFMTLR